MSLRFGPGKYYRSAMLGQTALGSTVGAGPSYSGPATASFSCWFRLLQTVQFAGGGYLPNIVSHGAFSLGVAANDPNKLLISWYNTASDGMNVAFPVQVGVAFHIAATFAAGDQSVYVNGYRIGGGTIAGPLQTNNTRRLVVGDAFDSAGNAFFDLAEPAYWTGHVLSQGEVTALRNHASLPTAVAPSFLRWALSGDGTTGATAAIGNPGLANLGTDPQADLAEVGGGGATYAGALSYEPPVAYAFSHVGGSGKTVFFSFAGATTGADADVTTINEHPTIAINGGPPIQLADPIWGVSGGLDKSLPYVLYPIEESIAPTDVVTATAPENWATTTLGPPPALAATPLTNRSGGSFVPAFDPGTPKAMRLGWNVTPPAYYFATPTYANMCKGGSRWYPEHGCTIGRDGYPTALKPGTTSITSVVQLCDASGGYPGSPVGRYRLLWDGPTLLELEPFNSPVNDTYVVEATRSLTGAADNEITYDVTKRLPGESTLLEIRAHGVGFSNVRLLPPGVQPTDRFHPFLLGVLRGSACIRAMDLLGTNNTNISRYSDFRQAGDYSYFDNAEQTIPVLSVAAGPPASDPIAAYFGYGIGVDQILLEITTDGPHGLSNGQTLGFSNVAPIPMTAGPDSQINGFPYFYPYVTGPDTFLIDYYHTPATATPVASTPAGTGAVVTVRMRYQNNPISEIVALVNEIEGCDLWFNVPHALDDAGVTAVAAEIAGLLAPGRKCHVEWSNEAWNGGFVQQAFNYGEAQLDETLDPETDPYFRAYREYARRSSRAHDLFEAAFVAAGRASGDVVRVYGGQFTNTLMCEMALAWAAENGKRVDAYAVAPYYSTGPEEESLYARIDGLDTEQLMDASEAFVLKGKYVKALREHAAALAPHPNVQLVCYEGGAESGMPVIAGKYPTWISDEEPGPAVKSRMWARHPRQAGILLALLQAASDIGVRLWCYFATGGIHGNIDGTGERTALSSNWAAYLRWDMLASPGDGSDGEFDNRTALDDKTRVNSVIGWAVKRWQAVQSGRDAFLVLVTSAGRYFLRARR